MPKKIVMNIAIITSIVKRLIDFGPAAAWRDPPTWLTKRSR